MELEVWVENEVELCLPVLKGSAILVRVEEEVAVDEAVELWEGNALVRVEVEVAVEDAVAVDEAVLILQDEAPAVEL